MRIVAGSMEEAVRLYETLKLKQAGNVSRETSKEENHDNVSRETSKEEDETA